MSETRTTERHDVVVVGAGAAAFALDHDLTAEEVGQAVDRYRASGAAVPA
ncbi:hypothetical protein ACGF12_26690 [Kitasatospora sp. NPDC048296]